MGEQESPSNESSKSSFYEELHKYLRREDMIQFFRLTNKGVFLQEDAFEMLYSAYQSWQQKKRGESEVLSVEKIRKRLIGNEALPLQYLVEGKKCLLGYLMPNSLLAPGSAKNLPTTGSLFDPQNYLDARDPIFQNTPGVVLRTTPKDGVLIEIKTKKQVFHLTTDTVKQFAEVCRNSPLLGKEFPETKESLRGCLLPLKSILERLRPLGQNHALLVPSDLLQTDNLFFQFKNLILVIRGDLLLRFFERKGKGEVLLLRSEMSKISGKEGDPRTIRGFTPNHEKGFPLGKIWIRGMSFLLHPNALMQFMRNFSRSKGKKRLNPRYSLPQVLLQFVPAFFRSQPLRDEESRKLPMRYRTSGAKYRRFADWVFVITDKNIISSCFLFREEKPRRLERTASQTSPRV